jgi:hypothetical protein
MWTRSAASKITGRFTVVCTDYSGNVFFMDEFDNLNDADRAGEAAERSMTMWENEGRPAPLLLESLLDEISDDELLREILA